MGSNKQKNKDMEIDEILRDMEWDAHRQIYLAIAILVVMAIPIVALHAISWAIFAQHAPVICYDTCINSPLFVLVFGVWLLIAEFLALYLFFVRGM